MKEEWRDVKGFSGYKVSNLGRVIKILKPIITRDGYEIVGVRGKDIIGRRRVHRLVLEAFKEQPEGKYECNHKDGNKRNNRVENLEWVTTQENIRHAIDVLGKKVIPPKKISKLSEDDVRRILKLRENKVKLRVIAKHFKISIPYTSELCNKKKRKNINQ